MKKKVCPIDSPTVLSNMASLWSQLPIELFFFSSTRIRLNKYFTDNISKSKFKDKTRKKNKITFDIEITNDN